MISSKVKKRILIAVLVSVFCHIAFLVWSYFVHLLPPTPLPEKTENVFHVKIAKQEQMGQRNPKYDTEFSRKSLKPDSPYTEIAATPAVESQELIKNKISSSVEKNKMALIPSSVQKAPVLKKNDFNDIIMTRRVRRAVRENLAELGEIPTEQFASGTPVVVSGEDISKHFLDKSPQPANASLAAPQQAANSENEFQVMKKASSGLEHQARATDLGTALTYQLYKYQDPSGQRYFKLVVKVRDATVNFPVIPKEVVFLLDASGSIGKLRLNQSVQGLIYSLKHLNPNDRFNILVIKDKTIPFSDHSLDPSPQNIRNAIEFLKGLKSWSETDIYDALRQSLNLDTSFVPSYRVLITDGFPTKGVVDTRRVINDISNMNGGRISIFTFGGGAQIDPYMLDFVAFKNRGWSSIADRDYAIARGLDKLYDEIKDPLLLNVRYYVSGLDDTQIFPQTMPDFFKGSQFVIYGRYTTEDRFVIQIRGDMVHEKKQFIVSGSLDNALAGNRQIAHDWAFHKVYYLIGQLKYNESNQPLLDAIHDLCAKFHIITPYSLKYSGSHPQPSRPKAAKGAKPKTGK